MPRQKKPWFRVYVEMVRDRKLSRLTPAQRWLWVVMMSCARESPVTGFLMLSERTPVTAVDLAAESGVALKQVEAGIKVMEELGMVEHASEMGAWFIPSWWDRQFESDHRDAHR